MAGDGNPFGEQKKIDIRLLHSHSFQFSNSKVLADIDGEQKGKRNM